MRIDKISDAEEVIISLLTDSIASPLRAPNRQLHSLALSSLRLHSLPSCNHSSSGQADQGHDISNAGRRYPQSARSDRVNCGHKSIEYRDFPPRDLRHLRMVDQACDLKRVRCASYTSRSSEPRIVRDRLRHPKRSHVLLFHMRKHTQL